LHLDWSMPELNIPGSAASRVVCASPKRPRHSLIAQSAHAEIRLQNQGGSL
jgi:hypothetical protein